MRPQPDLPPPPARGGRASSGARHRSGRGRAILGFVLAGTFILLVSLRGIAGFYTDYLWFSSLHLSQVFAKVLTAKLSLTLIGTVVFFLLCWGNMKIAERVAPPFRPSSGQDDLIDRYHEIVGNKSGLVKAGLAALLALIVGMSLGSNW